MSSEDESVQVLEEVARIHPALDRLRRLLDSATILELKATADPYWTEARSGNTS
jgi:hypothetical protein